METERAKKRISSFFFNHRKSEEEINLTEFLSPTSIVNEKIIRRLIENNSQM